MAFFGDTTFGRSPPSQHGWHEAWSTSLRAMAALAWFMIVVALGTMLAASEPGPTVVSDCTERGLLAGIRAGGEVRLACNGTVVLNAPIAVEVGANLELNGNEQDVVLHGNGATRLFEVAPGGTLTLRHVTLTGGSAANGGAIVNAGKLTVIDSTFAGNTAGNAGAIDNSGALSITDSTFTTNAATSAGGQGGAIRNGIEAVLTITTSTFSGNSASRGAGGAIENFFGTASLSASTVTGNHALTGGGIDNVGSLTVTRSTFDANHAVDGGAITNTPSVDDLPATAMIANSTFHANNATVAGGALNNAGTGHATVINSTFAENAAGKGASVWSQTESLTLKNSILANGRGAGECVVATITLQQASLIDGGGNVADDFSCGTYRQADPGLQPLQSAGGPTQTMPITGASPAFEAGVRATCLVAEPFGAGSADQRGFPRTSCSAGAFEPQLRAPAGPSVALTDPLVEGACVAVGGAAPPGSASRTLRTIRWDWGDGSESYSWFPASHLYREPGRHVIHLTAYWSDDTTVSASIPVQTTAPPSGLGAQDCRLRGSS